MLEFVVRFLIEFNIVCVIFCILFIVFLEFLVSFYILDVIIVNFLFVLLVLVVFIDVGKVRRFVWEVIFNIEFDSVLICLIVLDCFMVFFKFLLV